MTGPSATVLPGGHSEWEPPDPFSNSEVKTLCADASVDFVDVKVGHCQALNSMKTKPSPVQAGEGFFHWRMAMRRNPLKMGSLTAVGKPAGNRTDTASSTRGVWVMNC